MLTAKRMNYLLNHLQTYPYKISNVYICTYMYTTYVHLHTINFFLIMAAI